MSRRGSERRRFVRVAEDAVVDIKHVNGAVPHDSQLLNFSAGGVLLLAAAIETVDSELRVVLRLPQQDRPIEFVGRVVRVRTLSDYTHEIAVEFVGGSAADQRALQAVIAEYAAATPLEPRTA